MGTEGLAEEREGRGGEERRGIDGPGQGKGKKMGRRGEERRGIEGTGHCKGKEDDEER